MQANNKTRKRGKRFHGLVAGIVTAAVAISAGVMAEGPNLQPNKNAIVLQQFSNAVSFVGGTATTAGRLHIRIDGPNGTQVFDKVSNTGLVDWVINAGLPDGVYNYDAWFTPAAALHRAAQKAETENGAQATSVDPLYRSGVFVIKGGALQPQPAARMDRGLDVSAARQAEPSILEHAAGAVLNFFIPTAAAGTCNSHCIVAGAGDPQVTLDDTGSGATDIELESVIGGDAFQIDEDGGTTPPFVLMMSAPQNSLYIGPSGDIGMGTSTPAAHLDIVGGGGGIQLRLEDGSSNFFKFNTGPTGLWLKDRDGDDVLKLNHSATDNALVVDGSGIGIGTGSPGASLHIRQATGVELRVQNTSTTGGSHNMFRLINNAGKARFVISSGGKVWTFDNIPTKNSFAITRAGDDTLTEFRVDGNGNGYFTGDVYANGILLTSSRALKTAFTQIDETALLAKLSRLDILKWRYKSEPASAEHIGPMAEQFQKVFDLGDGKHLEMVDTTGIAFASIQALASQNQKLKAKLEGLRGQVADLFQAVEELRSKD